MKEITINELNNYPEEELQLIDTRDEGSIIYGMIPGAVNIAFSEFSDDSESWIAKLNNPYVEGNIFKSVENVILDTVIEYKQKGVRHNFLDDY